MSSAVALAAQMEECFASADVGYFICLVHSGVFSTSTCALACPHRSQSCCDSADMAQRCPAGATTQTCKALFDDTLFRRLQCQELSAPAVGAIVATCVLVAAVVCITWLRCRWSRAATTPRQRSCLRFEGQVRVLVWKNLRLRQHRPVKAVVEFALPLVFIAALVLLGALPSLQEPGRSASLASRGNCSGAAECDARLLATCRKNVPALLQTGEPSATATSFYSSGEPVFGLFFLLAYLRFVPSLTADIVREKEQRLTEGMKMLGVGDGALRLSWFLTGAVYNTPLALLVAIELKHGNVFPMADLATLFLFFAAFGLAIVSFATMVGVFFNKSKTAAVASALVWVVAFLPFYAVQDSASRAKHAAALSAPAAFALGIQVLAKEAQWGQDVYFYLAQALAPEADVSVGGMAAMLLLDALVMSALGWYLAQVVPQEYGVQKPWHFLFHPAYWRPQRRTGNRDDASDSLPELLEYHEMATPARDDFAEALAT
ncbi:ATP-binding Cassette (ABC) Superfamily, partial [Achlya hypogyna]